MGVKYYVTDGSSEWFEVLEHDISIEDAYARKNYGMPPDSTLQALIDAKYGTQLDREGFDSDRAALVAELPDIISDSEDEFSSIGLTEANQLRQWVNTVAKLLQWGEDHTYRL